VACDVFTAVLLQVSALVVFIAAGFAGSFYTIRHFRVTATCLRFWDRVFDGVSECKRIRRGFCVSRRIGTGRFDPKRLRRLATLLPLSILDYRLSIIA
jgi:hypothetical protein